MGGGTERVLLCQRVKFYGTAEGNNGQWILFYFYLLLLVSEKKEEKNLGRIVGETFSADK